MQMCLGSMEALLRKMLPYDVYEQILPPHLLLYNLLEVDFSVEKRTKQRQRKKNSFFSTCQTGEAVSLQKDHDHVRKEKLFHLQLFLRNT